MNFYYFLIFIITINTCSGSPRVLKYELNPGCGRVCDEKSLTTLHLKAEGPNDTLHYLWDFVGNPSVLLAVTSPAAKLNIEWDKYLTRQPKSINFTEEPIYTFGLVIQKIIEFNDVYDKATIDNVRNEDINILNPEYFNWTRKNSIKSNQFVELDMIGQNYTDPELNNITRAGNIEIILNGFCTLEHSDVIPHMLHSENSTQIDFIINHLRTNSSFNKSRFGLELMVVSEGDSSSRMSIDTKKSLDDEYTPGIFETIEMRTPENNKNKFRGSGYLQWRPVSYLTSHRDVTASTETTFYNIINCSNITNNSILYAFYGDSNNLLINKVNVTIGSSGDGFYKKTNYATWTFLVGYGNPPGEQFSYLVILIISIGVGLPVLIMSIAGIYICIRRLPRRESSRLVDS
ncbi:glycosylated lysosomal membrane protein [Cotesia typhae]|uniref:glycosylated lysosomal membrane protein n=1 Tax=Cotesia typhae TaxID=2053667 RepID=UPI003D686034